MRVELYVDPVCPFAWIASRWLLEVRRQRDLDLAFRLMSLAVLNEGRGNPENDRHTGPESGWRPARVAAALIAERGEPGLRAFVTAFGERYHALGVRPRDRVLREALAELDAGHLVAAADDPAWDDAVRAGHRAGIGPVGLDVGTPTLHVDGVAFFGPVLGRVPRGRAALDVFDGALLLAREPHFFELKRTRAGADLDFS
jgi:2-hydroxychromene-2-carboxylate isomerase